MKIWKLSRRRADVNIGGAHNAGNGVLSVEWLDEKQALSQSRDGTIKIWDIGNCANPVMTLESDTHSFCKCAVDEDGKLVAICKEEYGEPNVEIWDLNSNSVVQKVPMDTTTGKNGKIKLNKADSIGMCMGLQMYNTPSGEQMLASIYESGVVSVYSFKKMQYITCVKLHTEPGLCFAIDPKLSKVSSY